VGGELIDSALNLYRATPLKTIFTVKEAREYLETLSPEEQKYAHQHPYETGLKFAGIQMLGDVGTILKPLSNTGYAVGGIASGEGLLEGILKERIVSEELGIVDEDTLFWEWKKPERAVAGFLIDVVTDPLSWVGTGAVKKVPLPGKAGTAGLDGIKSFLTDEVATFTPETAFDRKAWKEAQEFNKKVAETRQQTNIPEEALAWQQFQHLEEQGASTKGSEIIQPRIESIAEKPQSITADSKNADNPGEEPIT